MSFLALRTLRARTGGFVGAFAALGCAAALITACAALLETGLRGEIRVERYADADLVVSADQDLHWTKYKKDKTKTKSKPLTEWAWLAEDVIARLDGIPGVAAVVPEVTFPAHVLVDGGRPLETGGNSWGHAWDSAALTPFTLRAGRPPTADDEVVLDADLARRAEVTVDDAVTVQAGPAPATYRVVGVAAPPAADGLDHQATIFFAAARARALAGHPGHVAAVGLQLTPGVEADDVTAAVRDALAGTGAEVWTGADRGSAEFPRAVNARVELISMGGALAGTSMLVAVLVVVGTFSLSVQQRRHELALLRTVGATPRQLRRMVCREALIVGLLAGGLGAVTGLGVARWLHGRFIALGALPDTLDLVLSPFAPAAAAALTILAAWIAARVSVQRVARIRPAEALAEATAPDRHPGVVRIVAGLVAAAGYLVLLLVLRTLEIEAAAAPVTFVSVVLAAIAVALLGPWLTTAATAILGMVIRWVSPRSGYLAARNARATTRRLAALVTPLCLAVAMAATILFTQTTLARAADRQVSVGTLATHTLVAEPGVPPAAVAAVGAVPGVDAVTELARTTVRLGQDKFPAQGVTPHGLERSLDLSVAEGALAEMTDDTLALSDLAARTRDASVGDDIEVTMGDGVKVTLRLIAVYERRLGFGDVTVPAALALAHRDNPAPDSVLVAGDANRPELERAVAEFPGVRVLDRAQVEAVRADGTGTAAQVNLVAMGLIITFTGIAVVNTLVMATSARRREFAALRLVGATPGQVLRMLRWETTTITLFATLLGTAVAWATLNAYSTGMAGGSGPYAPPLMYAAVVGTAAIVALMSTALPARLALQANPADTVGLRS